MSRRIAWQLIGPLALLLVGVVHAGIQRDVSARWLGTAGWELRDGGDGAYLAEGVDSTPHQIRWDRIDAAPKWHHHRWAVSAPTIQSDGGKFLSYSLKGRQPSVYLTKDKGDHTRWVFETVERMRPERAKSSDRKMKEGPEGYSFRVQAAEGEFKNWYLAAEEAPKDRRGAKRRLTLVRSKKQATVFDYVQKCYYVHHP